MSTGQKTRRYLLAGLCAAALAFTLTGCSAVVDPDGNPLLSGTNSKNNWGTPYVSPTSGNLDSRLLTESYDTVWVDVNREVGTWRFKYYLNGSQYSNTEAEQRYVGDDGYHSWNYWRTLNGKLYLQNIDTYSSKPDTVRAIYFFAINNGVLTLTDSTGTKVQFVKRSRDDLNPTIPPTAGHDPRLILSGNNGPSENWVSFKKDSELQIWGFGYSEYNYEYYVNNTKIDAAGKFSSEDFDSWYTDSANGLLYFLNDIGAVSAQYRYTVSTDKNALTLTPARGPAITLTKMTFEKMFEQITPAVLKTAMSNENLMGTDWENDTKYFWFGRDGMCNWSNGRDDYGMYWWYTSGTTLYLLNFLSGSAAKTYTYSITGVTLTLTGGGETIELYMDGQPPDPEYNERLITGEGQVWLPSAYPQGSGGYGGVRFRNGGDMSYNITQNSSSCCGSWRTSNDTLYITGGLFQGSSTVALKYTPSSDGKTVTLVGTYNYYDYGSDTNIPVPINMTVTKTARDALPPDPLNKSRAAEPSGVGGIFSRSLERFSAARR